MAFERGGTDLARGRTRRHTSGRSHFGAVGLRSRRRFVASNQGGTMTRTIVTLAVLGVFVAACGPRAGMTGDPDRQILSGPE